MRVPGVGDDGADFAAFYEERRDACLRAVAVIAGDREAAEDLVAEAFARAWARWPHVRCHPAPSAWVVRTALNTRVSWWRRRRREVEWGDHDPPDLERVGDTIDGTLLAALQRLPVRQREVIALRTLLDLDTETTAGALGIAPGTVTSHLARAVATLRRAAPHDPSPPMEVTR
ncbi:MAG TPA: SigE family RNA polymerase sigma factor [Acidimicrobiales bacterium]|nr:SigE family RNA polymerase sigma factor [Acidimicrobiales bacterium]